MRNLEPVFSPLNKYHSWCPKLLLFFSLPQNLPSWLHIDPVSSTEGMGSAGQLEYLTHAVGLREVQHPGAVPPR